jgi:hypothetical protein
MYAMDSYGNLFVGDDNKRYAKLTLGLGNTNDLRLNRAARADRGQMNHSSFCAGKDVICAGSIFFWKGQLLHIDNSSGHYRPSRHALYKAVEAVRREGTNLNILRVTVMGQPGVFSATSFLQNNQHGDWPSKDMGANHYPYFVAKGVQM